MTAAASLELQVALPERWVVHDPASWSALQTDERLDLVLRAGIAAAGTPAARPDLLASLFVPVMDETEEIQTIVMASVVVYVLSDSFEAAGPVESDSTRTVHITDDLAAEFYELSILAHIPDSPLSALATFTTPNLPLIAELASGFRSIAATIRCVSVAA